MAEAAWQEDGKGQHKMVLHRGGKRISRDELAAVPLPAEDGRYAVVPHMAVVELLENRLVKEFGVSRDRVDWSFATSHEGQRLFAMAALLRGPRQAQLLEVGEPEVMLDSSEWGPGFCFRNSYDKSTRFSFACGCRVFICDNLALSGEFVSYSRVHVGDAMEEIMQQITGAMAKAEHQIRVVSQELATFQARELSVVEGYRILGQAVGTKVVSQTQFGIAMRAWKVQESKYGARTAFRLYNEITEVLKLAQPAARIGRHVEAHRLINEAVREAA